MPVLFPLFFEQTKKCPTKKCLSFSDCLTDKEGQRGADKEVPVLFPLFPGSKCLSFSVFLFRFPAQNACPFPAFQNACPFPAFPAFCPFPAFSRKNACPFFLFSLFFLSLSFSLSFSRLFPLFESDSKISILSPHFFRLEIQECLSWMHPALDAPCVLDATWVHVPGCT